MHRYLSIFALLLLAAIVALSACNRDDDQPATQVDSVKIMVAEPGIYRVELQELQEAGLALDALSEQTLALSSGGITVPYLIENEALVFYGQATDNRFANQRAYIATAGESGLLIETGSHSAETNAEHTTVRQTLRLEENHFYDPRAIRPNVDEVWFWETIRNIGDEAVFTVSADLPAVDETTAAELRVNLYGASYDDRVSDDHDLNLIINGQTVDTIAWDGQTHYTATVPIPAGVLKAGKNEIQIDNSAAGSALLDIVLLNWMELDYTAPAAAIDDAISFAAEDGLVTIDAFSATPLILDVSDPDMPVALSSQSKDKRSVTVPATAAMQIVAAGPDGFMQPAAIAPILPSTWRDTTNQADLLIVTTAALAPEMEPLAAAREAQGLATAIVPVEAIYDAFGNGEPSPDAINAFVRYAVAEWQAPAPAYLFLVGDATTDTHGYLASRPDNPIALPANLVPSPLIEVSHGGETVSDARLADVDGDLRPDLAVGRWPVADADEVRDLVKRTLAYEAGISADNALFTLDGTSSEFAAFTDRLLTKAAFAADHATVLDGPSAQTVADTWNSGAWLVSYVGHGSLDLWGKDEVFTVDQVAGLEAGNTPPIVLQFTCLSGQFAHPEIDSLSETLLKHESGPVLLIAATSLTLSTHQEPFAVALLQALQDPAVIRVGDALQFAKGTLNTQNSPGLQEISDTFGLLGDPSALIVRPALSQSTAAGS